MTETQTPETKYCHHQHHTKVSEPARLSRSKIDHRAALLCEGDDDPVITASRVIVCLSAHMTDLR